jgi:hypothetical protein
LTQKDDAIFHGKDIATGIEYGINADWYVISSEMINLAV